jgi:hypothetical protein
MRCEKLIYKHKMKAIKNTLLNPMLLLSTLLFCVKNYYPHLSAALLFVLVWEHICRQYKSTYRPSVFLRWCSDTAKSFFSLIGKYLAQLSSFYTYINLEEMKRTVSDVFTPLVELMFSPWYTVKTYLSTAAKYKYWILVPLGTLTFMVLAYYCYATYNKDPTQLWSWTGGLLNYFKPTVTPSST